MQRITAYLSSLLLSRRDDGYSTETVIVTAVLIGVAIAAATGIGTFVKTEVGGLSAEIP
ncbi:MULTISPECIES: hypothetical protein [unclassified Nocardiopsis]|uniref:hypothetical protein n=1 Tax=unclassified Nocardiopsis TaxID=2649073 RepID=UPI0018FE3D2A|nr:hypothetical protein [Nocardiopsis sp. TSRI0078]